NIHICDQLACQSYRILRHRDDVDRRLADGFRQTVQVGKCQAASRAVCFDEGQEGSLSPICPRVAKRLLIGSQQTKLRSLVSNLKHKPDKLNTEPASVRSRLFNLVLEDRDAAYPHLSGDGSSNAFPPSAPSPDCIPNEPIFETRQTRPKPSTQTRGPT